LNIPEERARAMWTGFGGIAVSKRAPKRERAEKEVPTGASFQARYPSNAVVMSNGARA